MKYSAGHVALHPGLTYKSPSGRPCQIEAPLFHSAKIAHFVYTDEAQYFGRGKQADGFTLARDNWHLMRAWP